LLAISQIAVTVMDTHGETLTGQIVLTLIFANLCLIALRSRRSPAC
jgi:hypothetical protein